jgi:hypothetical protein
MLLALLLQMDLIILELFNFIHGLRTNLREVPTILASVLSMRIVATYQFCLGICARRKMWTRSFNTICFNLLVYDLRFHYRMKFAIRSIFPLNVLS